MGIFQHRYVKRHGIITTDTIPFTREAWIETLRTLRLVEAKIALRAKKKSAGEERQIRAAETQYSVLHRMLNVLVVLATIGAALMVFDQVRAFGASLLTSAGIAGLVAGVAAQRTLQNIFAGLQLAISQPIALRDVVGLECTSFPSGCRIFAG